jgi:hypothetical protein
MRHWFLSFNSSDRALAERLKASIECKDAGSHVFFDATSLRAGGYWQPALAKGIDEADAFVLLVGEKGLGLSTRVRSCTCAPRSASTDGFRR